MKKATAIQALLAIATAMLLPVPLQAQGSIPLSRSAIDSLVHPALLEKGAEILQFKSIRQDIGTLGENDAPRTVSFVFRNVSPSPVTVTRIQTSCGCTAASFGKQAVAPGQEGTITLRYNPKNRPGTVDTEAYVYTSASEKHPVARLSLTGNVLPDGDEWRHLPQAMGTLRLKRKQVTFSEVKSTQQPSERIACANSGTTSLKLSAQLLPDYASFRTEPEVLQPGQEGDLVISIDGSRMPADKKGVQAKFPILVEGVAGRPSDRMIQVVITSRNE